MKSLAATLMELDGAPRRSLRHKDKDETKGKRKELDNAPSKLKTRPRRRQLQSDESSSDAEEEPSKKGGKKAKPKKNTKATERADLESNSNTKDRAKAKGKNKGKAKSASEPSPEPSTASTLLIGKKRPLLAADEPKGKRPKITETKEPDMTARIEQQGDKSRDNLSSMLTAAGVSKKQLCDLLCKLAETDSADEEDAERRDAARTAHLRSIKADDATKQPSHRPLGIMKAPATAQPAGIMGGYLSKFHQQPGAGDVGIRSRLAQAQQRAADMLGIDSNPFRDLANGADLATVLMEGNQRVAANDKLLSFDDELSSYDARAGNTKFYGSDFLAKYLRESYAKDANLLQTKICTLAKAQGKTIQFADALSAKNLNPKIDGIPFIAVLGVLEYVVRRNLLLTPPEDSLRSTAVEYVKLALATRKLGVLVTAWPKHTVLCVFEEMGRNVIPNEVRMDPIKVLDQAIATITKNPQLGHTMKPGFAASSDDTFLLGWQGALMERVTAPRATLKVKTQTKPEFDPTHRDYVPRPWCPRYWSRTAKCVPKRGGCRLRHEPKWTEIDIQRARKKALDGVRE